MKLRHRLLFSALLLAVWPAFGAAPAKPLQLTFGNVEWFSGARPNASVEEQKKQTDLVQREIVKLAPDILGMAELRDGEAAALDDDRFKQEQTLRSLAPVGLLWAFKGIAPAGRVTLPGSHGFPDTTFDHIFIRDARIVRAFVSKTPPEASDHRPVTAIIEPAVVAKK